jgi:tetratricopeptide (TPR) repeat protein
MKRPILFILITLISSKLFAAGFDADSLKQKVMAYSIHADSLKQELELVENDSLKASIYTQIALEYIKYDTIANKKIRVALQNLALTNTYSALHLYSRYNDTAGLRTSFNNLAKVYQAQHKYPQAKWFILQSNTLSRYQNDNANIITSLITLASIKSDIKDYSLAMRDLNEALTIASKNHYSERESEVQLNYAMLYSKMKNYAKSALALKRHKEIDDSTKHIEETKLMAKLAERDSLIQAKKKLYTISNSKSSKNNSSKRIASL